jgi:hypothetical protein
MSSDTVYARLDAAMEEAGGSNLEVELTVGSEYRWGCELRFTPQPNYPHNPEHVVVFHASGGASPDDVLERALDDYEGFRAAV